MVHSGLGRLPPSTGFVEMGPVEDGTRISLQQMHNTGLFLKDLI